MRLYPANPAERRKLYLELIFGVGLLLIVYLWVEYADPNTVGMSLSQLFAWFIR